MAWAGNVTGLEARIGVDEVACLIDYGIEKQTVLNGLTLLAEQAFKEVSHLYRPGHLASLL